MPNRNIVRDGSLDFRWEGVRQRGHIYIFNDMILITKTVKPKAGAGGLASTFSGITGGHSSQASDKVQHVLVGKVMINSDLVFKQFAKGKY